MLGSGDQPRFTLQIHGVQTDLQVLRFTGREALGAPYLFAVELVSEDPAIDLEHLLHKLATLQIGGDGQCIHGQIACVAQGDTGARLTHYRLELVPRLAYLEHNRDLRIFQQQTVPQIIAAVLKAHGILADAYRFQLGPTVYSKRDYCTQYDETDLAFIQRLCAEEGLHYHFEHSPDGHLLVFGDDQSAFPRLARPTRFAPDSGQARDQPVVNQFGARVAACTARASRRGYDFEKPNLVLHGAHQPELPVPQPDVEDYGFPGDFTDREDARHVSQRALEGLRADYLQAEGKSDQPALRSGYFFTLAAHPRDAWNALWLLAEVTHEGYQPQVLEEAGGEGGAATWQGYRNQFKALPWGTPYRPPAPGQRPRIHGAQTARVTGPAGEEIHCDALGRIKVQFHWDRDGQRDEKTSCWLRVASNWAGNGYGSLVIPRVGMEVLVAFLDGDPDRPVVAGCLYNAAHLPPLELPANKTRSVFKTASSPGAEGSNELRIEDRQGQEQIFIHAQRDWEQNVGNDQRVQVRNERHDAVHGDVHSEYHAQQHRTVHGDRKTELRGDDHLNIANSRHMKLGQALLVEAGQEVHLSAGRRLVLDAGSEVVLRAGGGFVRVDANGVTFGKGLYVDSNGQVAGGTPAMPLPPGATAQAEQAVAGRPLTQAQLDTFRRNAAFCEECERCKEGACDL